jgi:hypothetical protein
VTPSDWLTPNIETPGDISTVMRYMDQRVEYVYLDNFCPEFLYNYTSVYT